MIIKELYNEEAYEFRKLCAQLFHGKLSEDFEQTLSEYDLHRGGDFTRLGVFDERLLGGLEIIPYTVGFDGHEIKMGGIGAVVSAHEARGRGVVKALFSKSFEVMREKNQILSHLYPFRGDYYRRYDYEVSCESTVWSVPSEYLRPSKSGEIRSFDGSDGMKNTVRDIYEAYTSGRNLCIKSKNWEDFFRSVEPSVTNKYAYINYTNGIPDGFLAYTFDCKPDKRPDIGVPVFWYKNKAGIGGLLSFLSSLKDYSDRCFITCPDDLGAFIEFNGGWGKRDTVKSVEFCGSSRVIDVEKMLSLADFDGKACIKINDSFCLWNNDVFTVESGRVTRGGTPDAECGIGTFSSLILGRYDNLSLVPGLGIYGNEHNLKKLFRKKPMLIDEHF